MSNDSTIPTTPTPVASPTTTDNFGSSKVAADSSSPDSTTTIPTPPSDSPNPDSTDSVVVTPNLPDTAPTIVDSDTDIPSEVIHRISESHNVLIALSSDPSVDELATAIGLSVYLDRLGKRATAIYSGSTPNALEFLKPEETFEPTADTLQDFVVALNKDKADHIRYKLDGDYVKIFITPYRHRIAEEDLDFSYGDFNVDLVLALDVANGIDLDAALREHGRIMHNAVIINITTGNPGKFGEIEWSDKSASSISEMIAKLLYETSSKVKIEKEDATAFLTGIVAATNRFSNAGTTPDTMRIASRLMESGANQQLISKNITSDMENEIFASGSLSNSSDLDKQNLDPTSLDIEHGDEENTNENKEINGTITEKESTLLDDLKAAEASLAQTGAETTPDLSNRPVRLDGPINSDALPEEPISSDIANDSPEPSPSSTTEPPLDDAESNDANDTPPESLMDNTTGMLPSEPSSASGNVDSGFISPDLNSETTLPEATGPLEPSNGLPNEPLNELANESTDEPSNKPESETIISPSPDFNAETVDEDTNKYGKMLEEALASSTPPSSPVLDTPSTTPSITPPDLQSNPAAMSAPAVSTTPEINGVPEINYMPLPGDEILPPPPTPPINISSPESATIEPIASASPTSASDNLSPSVTPTSTPTTPSTPAPEASIPSLPTPVPADSSTPTTPPPSAAPDPSAFKIPGM